MNLSTARATIGLQAKATPTSTAVGGSVPIGANPTVVSFPDADVIYAVRAFFALEGLLGSGWSSFFAYLEESTPNCNF